MLKKRRVTFSRSGVEGTSTYGGVGRSPKLGQGKIFNKMDN